MYHGETGVPLWRTPQEGSKDAMHASGSDAYSGFHPFRHSGASVMENNNVPIGGIQKVLGHENRETTEIYLHTARDSQRRAFEAYEQAC